VSADDATTAWARRRIAFASAGTLVGIVLCIAVDQTLGGWLTVVCVALLLHALHRFGRTGPG
jgi:O-antigen ligase